MHLWLFFFIIIRFKNTHFLSVVHVRIRGGAGGPCPVTYWFIYVFFITVCGLFVTTHIEECIFQQKAVFCSFPQKLVIFIGEPNEMSDPQIFAVIGEGLCISHTHMRAHTHTHKLSWQNCLGCPVSGKNMAGCNLYKPATSSKLISQTRQPVMLLLSHCGK